jgi:zinc D-Ala-D-Ala dipeptidase
MQFSYKIKIICTVCIIVSLQLFTIAFSQLKPVKDLEIYKQQVRDDSLQKMIGLKTFIPSLIYDLRYATKNNFTHKRLYKNTVETFVRLPVAKALRQVQNDLAQNGYGLKVFDAYRPYSVTQKMWELVHDERYVANPSKGSGHNRGLAIDVTIVHLNDKTELNMGTGFDNFTDTAHHTFKNLLTDVSANRKLLKETMEKYGFQALETEWWHYSWTNDRNYEVLDLGFKTLKKAY